MGSPLTLALPTIVTNPLGISKLIVWSAMPTGTQWLSLDSSSITINSSDSTLIGSLNSVTIKALDTISGLYVENKFKVLFKCTTAVDCTSSSTFDITYFVTNTTRKTISKCILTPSFCIDTTEPFLTSVGFSASPPVNFASIARNTDNTFTITIPQNDVLLTGLTYEFKLTFTNFSVTSVTQPADRNFKVFVKCI
jgi:hypothetical protein